MATTSYLYHTMGLQGYRHLSTEYKKGKVVHHIERPREHQRCRGCRAPWYELVFDGKFERTFKGLPIGSRAQDIVLHGHELYCRRCGKKLREPIPFAHGSRRHLKAFERYVVDLCQIAPIKHVAEFLGVSWGVIKEIFKDHLQKRQKEIKLNKVRYIAVDEFAVLKGHQYMTVVLDLETGRILNVSDDRRIESLAPFLRKLKAAGAKLEAVAMAMWLPYLLAVKEVLPEVDIVHDRYHVVSMANFAIDETRRDMYRSLIGQERGILKGSRFLLLKGGEKLDQDGREHLQRLEQLNQPLYQAYLLKEELRRFWLLGSCEEGEIFLTSWIDQALRTGLKHFVRLAKTLNRHRQELLSYFKHRITTGPLEGLNNKIKVLKRQAYGFRDMEYFRLRLAFIHEDLPRYSG